MPIPNPLFVRLTFSAVKAPKVTQISISERQQALTGDRVTGTACVFGSTYTFRLKAEGLTNRVPFLRGFFIRLTILLL